MIREWRRWDPRIEPKTPMVDVRAFPKWIIEVVPDIFEAGAEKLMKKVLDQISMHRNSNGRFLLRTANVDRALHVLRRLREGSRMYHTIPNDRIILAVYAETQEQFEQQVDALFAKRVTPLDKIEMDPNEAIAMALREGVIWEFNEKDAREQLSKGNDSLRSYLKSRMNDMRYCECIPVEHVAVYVSPRENIDISTRLLPRKHARDEFIKKHGDVSWYDGGGWHEPPKQIDWVICAGRIGPISDWNRMGPAPNDPHPMHYKWIVNALYAARAVNVPFCLPYLGEWAFTQGMTWKNDELVTDVLWSSSNKLDNDKVDSTSVDYDPSWAWGERDWGPDNPGKKPGDSYMQAIGSHLTGRALAGRVFDEWPRWSR